MKGSIHPNYSVCKVRCACGNEFETASLKEEIRVDICSNCHPFYTGKQKFVDTAGRVQKFEKRFNWSEMEALEKAKQKTAAQKKKKKVQKIGKVKLIRQVEGGTGSQAQQNSMTLHCGLGKAEKVDEVTVYWPGGKVQKLGALKVKTIHNIKVADPQFVVPRRGKLFPPARGCRVDVGAGATGAVGGPHEGGGRR